MSTHIDESSAQLSVSLPTFDINQQQQLVYASLMRFGSETISLRHRCLDHVVMNGLLGASIEHPLKIGELQRKLHFGTHAPILRPEVLRETLLRLEKENKVAWVLVKKKRAYYLTQQGINFMTTAVVSAEGLYKPVLARLLAHTDHLISADIGAAICTTFICEAFSRCGVGIAKDLQGRTDFPHQGDLSAAFSAAVNGRTISDEARRTLEVRCLSLFKSRDLEDKRLIFYLTQGYYFTQLLGLDNGGFDPIAEQAFVGAVFYLDTNVLLPGLLPGDRGRALIEMINVAKRNGITLRITRASINEARRVAADRLNELKRIQDKVPAELAEKSLDDFITFFYEQRKTHPDLTPEEYLKDFERLSETVETWGVEIDELVEDEMINGRSFSVLEACIQGLAAKYRKGRTKSEGVLRHDIAHYALVQDKRQANAKTWFLTRDRSLISSAESICGEEAPFCFGLIGFLQSISPYVMSDVEGNSLSTVFSELLKEQVITKEKLFDSRELVLLAEMHSDVLSTPLENLLPAVDFVKSSVLKGRAYKIEDFPLVSLELRKFLASSKDEQKQVLETLNARLQSEAQTQRDAAIESRKARLAAEDALLAKESELDDQSEQLQLSERENADLRKLLDKNAALRRLAFGISGMVGGILMWMFGVQISSFVQSLVGKHNIVDSVLQAMAGVIFCWPPINFLRRVEWRTEVKGAIGSLIVFVALWVTKVVSATTAADVASYLAIGGVVASVFIFPKQKD